MPDNNPFLPRLVTYPNTISYKDGSEELLFDIVSEPAFDEFISWKNKPNWALYYHLSPLRRNILSWINFGKKPLKILELGAGCGAITSYLVTIADSQIVAVEGSMERAKVIQARCKGADNLSIHACPIDSFKPDCKFDLITLIGVLEYSGKYVNDSDPFAYVLKLTNQWLAENGSLIVAIENQLGVKYLSGCAEDHYGKSYEGVNNYPHYNGIKTFTKGTLSSKLNKAGYNAQSWYYPYPDYKLSSVIYSDLAFSQNEFDFIALTDVPQEPNENPNPLFSNRSFLSLVQQTAPVGAFMNSFLTVASKNDTADFIANNSGMVAVKTNVKFRRQPFQTSTSFNLSDGKIAVKKERLYPQYPLPEGDIRLNISGQPEPYYSKTMNVFDAIVNSVLQNNYKKALDHINVWIEILKQHAIESNDTVVNRFIEFAKINLDVSPDKEFIKGQWICGSCIDLIPLNILIPLENEGEPYRIIDLEWQILCDIPLQLVFDRGMNLLISKLQRILKAHNLNLDPKTLLPYDFQHNLNSIQLFLSMNTGFLAKFEGWFQQNIMGTIDVPALDKFVETVVTFVEQGKKKEALEYYDKYRNFYSGVRDLKQFDKIVESMRHPSA